MSMTKEEMQTNVKFGKQTDNKCTNKFCIKLFTLVCV